MTMAQKVQIDLVDDIDGTPADETVRFGIDNKNYEIDLNSENAKALREGLGEWVTAARKAGTANAPRKQINMSARSRRAREIRTWAASNGYDLALHGRIPSAVTAAYEAANAS
jgi:Lsr2